MTPMSPGDPKSLVQPCVYIALERILYCLREAMHLLELFPFSLTAVAF